MDEIAPLFFHILPTTNDGLSYAEQKVSTHYYNEKCIMSNIESAAKPIQKYREDRTCRRCIRITRTMTNGGMPFVQHRHTCPHVCKGRNERADPLRLHPFFS